MANIEGFVKRLETVSLKLGAGGAEGGVAPCVTAWDDLYAGSVQPFIDACNKIEGTKKIGDWTKTALTHVGVVIQAAQDCAKPSQEDFMKFLAPIVKIIGDAGNPAKGDTFPQEKSFHEVIQSLSWVMMPGPKAFCIAQLEAADFYLNKILMKAKDASDDDKKALREYVSSVKKMVKDMADYTNEFHKQGIAWKYKGSSLNDWKPGASAAASAGPTTMEERLEALCRKMEAYSASLGGEDAEGTPIRVSDYQAFYKEHVTPFIDACNKLEGTKKIAGWAEKAFQHLEKIITMAHAHKKPGQEAFMKALGPIVEVITATGNPDNRADTFPQEKSFAECIQAMNWVMIDLPAPFVRGQLEASDFYLNKALVAAKDKEDPEKTDRRAYVKTIKAMMQEFAAYIQKHYKTGLEWNPKGEELK